MADLYRKSSLDKLSNPEQLDRMIKISSPLSWLALIAVLLVIAATVVWSIIGTLPTTETVSGMIVDSNSVNAVYSESAGTLEKYCVEVGKDVKIEPPFNFVIYKEKLYGIKKVIIYRQKGGEIDEV